VTRFRIRRSVRSNHLSKPASCFLRHLVGGIILGDIVARYRFSERFVQVVLKPAKHAACPAERHMHPQAEPFSKRQLAFERFGNEFGNFLTTQHGGDSAIGWQNGGNHPWGNLIIPWPVPVSHIEKKSTFQN